MSHVLAKLSVDEDGEPLTDGKETHWHLAESITGNREAKLLCTAEYIDDGCHSGLLKCEIKTVKRGGITCPECLEKLKAFKAIKL